jgi:hypothetical protein
VNIYVIIAPRKGDKQMENAQLFAIILLLIIISTASSTIVLIIINKEQMRHNKAVEQILLNIRWNNYRTANQIADIKAHKETE